MMNKTILTIALIATLTACATKPPGPSVAVMPGAGKPFDVFRFEDYECRQFADSSVGTDPNKSAATDTAKTAAVGAALGAVAGVLMGDSGRSAATGAGIGLVGGAIAGSGAGSRSSDDVQRRYDIAYQQCMYSKGNQIPGYRSQPQSKAPVPMNPPPPPPGYTPR
ncbi:YMGG-like glycine zipper-containing protein [Polynucleobacter rarus]|uniref:YMGG-like glycine zipper-containing protein n=1 Tax=Polynucleobacter rarus TaxID=556055 RepID=UPI001FE5DBF8|nr:hypothetical protein [Polynucleobacter rarus]